MTCGYVVWHVKPLHGKMGESGVSVSYISPDSRGIIKCVLATELQYHTL